MPGRMKLRALFAALAAALIAFRRLRRQRLLGLRGRRAGAARGADLRRRHAAPDRRAEVEHRRDRRSRSAGSTTSATTSSKSSKSSAQDDGEPFDYAKEVEPWLGERAAVFFEKLDENDDPTGLGIVVESTDADATQEFVDKQVKASDDPYKSGSYEGVDYEVGGDEDNVIGVVGDFLVDRRRREGLQGSRRRLGGRIARRRRHLRQARSRPPPTAASPTSTSTSAS